LLSYSQNFWSTQLRTFFCIYWSNTP